MGCNANKAAGTPAGVACDFAVIVDKAAADTAGLKAVPGADGKHLIVESVKDSAMQGKTDAEKVCPGDQVMCVNGVHGDAKKMVEVIDKASKKTKLNLAIKKKVASTAAPTGETQGGVEPIKNAESGPEAAAQKAVSDVPLKDDGTPVFDGVWNPKALINGKKLVWLVDNSEAMLSFIGQNKCSVIFDGKEYTATMEEENRLVWDDGDVWMRDGEAGASSAREPERRVSEQKQAACMGLC